MPGNFGAMKAELTEYCMAELTCGGGGGDNLATSSVVFASKTSTKPSEDAVITFAKSLLYTAEFT